MADIVRIDDFRQVRVSTTPVAKKQTSAINAVRVTGNAWKVKKPIYFNREELSRLMGFYSQMVAAGNLRDYAIDHMQGQALFSVYRHANEAPVFMVSKQAQQSGKGREYMVYAGIKRLKRSERLDDILAALLVQAQKT